MKKSEQTEKKTFFSWVRDHAHVLMVFAGIILIIMSLKTQTVLITDSKSEQYTVELQYSVFGYCVSAVPMTEQAQPIAADHMFLMGSIDSTVQKAASWIYEKTGEGVSVYVSGYPRNNDKLTEHIFELLEQQSIPAKEINTESK